MAYLIMCVGVDVLCDGRCVKNYLAGDGLHGAFKLPGLAHRAEKCALSRLLLLWLCWRLSRLANACS